jgi:hypothetical protein
MPVPCNIGEMFSQYSRQIQAYTKGSHLLESHLKETFQANSPIDSFKVPTEITGVEAAHYFNMTWKDFKSCDIILDCRPNSLIDVTSLYEYYIGRNRKKAPQLVAERFFELHLEAQMVAAEASFCKAKPFEITYTGYKVPRKYNENKEFDKYCTIFVQKCLYNNYKIPRENLEEANQKVWLGLLKADFLSQFYRRMAKNVPFAVTAERAARLLGVSWDTFRTREWRWRRADQEGRHKSPKWMPEPSKIYFGKPKSWNQNTGYWTRLNEYRLSDLEYLRAIWAPKQAFEPEKLTLTITQHQFNNYLGSSVRTHHCNDGRTGRRHFDSEFTQDPNPETKIEWEDTLVDYRGSAPDMLADYNLKVQKSKTLSEINAVWTGEASFRSLAEAGYKAKQIKEALLRMGSC